MLPTLIQKYNKKSFHFWNSSKQETNRNFTRCQDATFYDCISTIYQFIKPFLDKKCLLLRNMEPLSTHKICFGTNMPNSV